MFKPRPKRFKKRHIFAVLGFLGFFNVYAMRVNLSIALVAMVYSPPTSTLSADEVTCVNLIKDFPSHQDFSNTTYPEKGFNQFFWSSQQQSVILGAFFYGYVITQIPGGYVAERYGAKWLYGVGILVTSVFTLLTPLAANWGFWPLVIARAIEGLGEGVTYPAMNALIGRWSPKLERSRTSSFVFTGSAIGTVVSMATSGILADTYGWEWVFYLFGLLGIIWCVPWILLVHESPETHPTISLWEKAYILKGRNSDHISKQKPPTPWRSILTSVPVWTLAVTHFGQGWGFYTLLTEMPTYLSNVLHFDIRKNGVISSIPYLMQALFSLSGSVVADKMRAADRLSITTIRKIFNSLAFFVPALLVFAAGFVGCQPSVIIFLFTLSVGFNGLIHSGFNVTHVDMSPEFAGTLMGITNCVSNFSGFLAPAYVGWEIKNGQTVANWQHVFVTTSTVLCCTGIIFNIFGTAEPQPWGRTSYEQSSSESSSDSESDAPTVHIPR